MKSALTPQLSTQRSRVLYIIAFILKIISIDIM